MEWKVIFMQNALCFRPNYNSQVYKLNKIEKGHSKYQFLQVLLHLSKRVLKGLKNKGDILHLIYCNGGYMSSCVLTSLFCTAACKGTDHQE